MSRRRIPIQNKPDIVVPALFTCVMQRPIAFKAENGAIGGPALDRHAVADSPTETGLVQPLARCGCITYGGRRSVCAAGQDWPEAGFCFAALRDLSPTWDSGVLGRVLVSLLLLFAIGAAEPIRHCPQPLTKWRLPLRPPQVLDRLAATDAHSLLDLARYKVHLARFIAGLVTPQLPAVEGNPRPSSIRSRS